MPLKTEPKPNTAETHNSGRNDFSTMKVPKEISILPEDQRAKEKETVTMPSEAPTNDVFKQVLESPPTNAKKVIDESTEYSTSESVDASKSASSASPSLASSVCLEVGGSNEIIEALSPSRRERLKKALREKENRLNASLKAAKEQEAMLVSLSEAAFSFKMRLQRKTEEVREIQRHLSAVDAQLKVSQQHKSELEKELAILQQCSESQAEQIRKLDQKLLSANESLDKLEQEKSRALQNAEALQHEISEAQRENSWLKGEVEHKTEQVEYYDYQLMAKNKEIDEIRLDLNDKSRRIVELEIDLETHENMQLSALDERGSVPRTKLEKHIALSHTNASLSFSEMDGLSFASSWKSIPDEKEESEKNASSRRFRFLRNKKKANDSFTSASMGDQDTPTHPEHYLATIDQLQRDLSSLERRYKRDKYRSKMIYEKLKHENSALVAQILDPEKRNGGIPDHVEVPLCEAKPISIGDGDTSKAIPIGKEMGSSRLEDKVAALETENRIQKQAIDSLQHQIARIKSKARFQAQEGRLAIKALENENEAKSVVIAELQTKREGLRTKKDIAKSIESKTGVIQEQTRQQVGDVLRLHRLNALKDQKIKALTSEIVELRMKAGDARS